MVDGRSTISPTDTFSNNVTDFLMRSVRYEGMMRFDEVNILVMVRAAAVRLC